METKIEDGGPMANMSMRDIFAANAMTALIGLVNEADVSDPALSDTIATGAYGIADKMLLERSKPKGQDGK